MAKNIILAEQAPDVYQGPIAQDDDRVSAFEQAAVERLDSRFLWSSSRVVQEGVAYMRIILHHLYSAAEGCCCLVSRVNGTQPEEVMRLLNRLMEKYETAADIPDSILASYSRDILSNSGAEVMPEAVEFSQDPDGDDAKAVASSVDLMAAKYDPKEPGRAYQRARQREVEEAGRKEETPEGDIKSLWVHPVGRRPKRAKA